MGHLLVQGRETGVVKGQVPSHQDEEDHPTRPKIRLGAIVALVVDHLQNKKESTYELSKRRENERSMIGQRTHISRQRTARAPQEQHSSVFHMLCEVNRPPEKKKQQQIRNNGIQLNYWTSAINGGPSIHGTGHPV